MSDALASLLSALTPADRQRLDEICAPTPVPEGREAKGLRIARIDDLHFTKDLRLSRAGLDWPDSLRSGYVEIRDAVVTPTGFVVAGDRFVFNTQILPNGWMRGASGGSPELVARIRGQNFIHKLDPWRETCLVSLPAEMEEIEEPAFLFNSRLACFNFGHFVQDTLTATPTYRDCAADLTEKLRPLIVGPGFPNATMTRIFAAAVGEDAPEPLFVRGRFYRVKQLYVPNTHFAPAEHAVARAAVHRLRATLARAFAAFRGPARRLFVNRTDSTRDDSREPRFANEPELVAALGRLGFESVAASRLAGEDYLRAFVSAEILVGLHGAGLWNLVLAQSPRVVEINVPGFVDWHAFALLMQRGMGAPYRRVALAAPAGGIAEYDVPAIVAACEALLATPCPQPALAL